MGDQDYIAATWPLGDAAGDLVLVDVGDDLAIVKGSRRVRTLVAESAAFVGTTRIATLLVASVEISPIEKDAADENPGPRDCVRDLCDVQNDRADRRRKDRPPAAALTNERRAS